MSCTEEYGEEGEDDEEAEVPEGEDAQEGGFLLGIVFAEKFEGDELASDAMRVPRRDEIDGGAEGGEIAGEAGEQNGGGNVADDLAGENAEPEFATVHEVTRRVLTAGMRPTLPMKTKKQRNVASRL